MKKSNKFRFNRDQLFKVINDVDHTYCICYLKRENIDMKFLRNVDDINHPLNHMIMESAKKQILQTYKEVDDIKKVLIVFYDRINKLYAFVSDTGSMIISNFRWNIPIIKRFLTRKEQEECDEVCQICFDNHSNVSEQCIQCHKRFPCFTCFSNIRDERTGLFECPFCRHHTYIRDCVYLDTKL